MVLAILLSLDVIVLVTWQVIDPLKRELDSFPHEKPQDITMDIEIKPQLEHCRSEHVNIWLGRHILLSFLSFSFCWGGVGHLSLRCMSTFVIFSIGPWPFLSAFLPPLLFLDRSRLQSILSS